MARLFFIGFYSVIILDEKNHVFYKIFLQIYRYNFGKFSRVTTGAPGGVLSNDVCHALPFVMTTIIGFGFSFCNQVVHDPGCKS